MARPQVPDTTELIRLIRNPSSLGEFYRSIVAGHLYLCSVVAAELYAGTRSAEDAALLDRIVAAADRIERLLTPTAEEWTAAGRLIARRIRLQGSLEPRDHLADVLIVVSAARLKAEVISANAKHIEPWVLLAQRGGMDVILAD